MAKDIFYTAIDIGTSKICTIIAQVGPEGDLKIVGTGMVPSQGIHKGDITDSAEASIAIRASLEEAQRYMGSRVPWAYASISGSHVTCFNTTGLIHPNTQERPVSMEDVEQLIQTSYPDVVEDREVLHVIPVNYMIDGFRGVRNPVGLHAGRLQVESHVVLGERNRVMDIVSSVEECGVPVKNMVLGALASSEATLTKDEREMGVVLADIGAGTTDIAIFKDGNLWYNSSLSVGGNQITRDLSVALGLPFYFAEELKVKWSHASPNGVESEEEVLLPSFQGRPRRLLRRTTLCKPLVDRLQETLGLIMVKIQQAGLNRFPPGGLVITGGTAETPGFQHMATRFLSCPVRMASPMGVQGLLPEQRRPSYSTVVGLLLWGIRNHSSKMTFGNGKKSSWESKTIVEKIKKVITAR